MIFDPPLIPVRFLRRYQRFLADVELPDGSPLTIHVPNSGSMATCLGAGWPALASDSGNPARRLRHTLEMLHNGVSWIGVQTQRANVLAREALEGGLLPALGSGWVWRAEVRAGGSRLDFLGERPSAGAKSRGGPDHGKERIWVEVKSVTLRLEGRRAAFPDSVTTRGLKHLQELCALRAGGDRALLLLLVQREDVDVFQPADHIDPAWGAELRRAAAAGVELAALGCRLCPESILPVRLLPIILS